MNINALHVNGLFDCFDHKLKFNPDERVMIMIGPNGFGKTMTLRIIDALFNQPLSRVVRLPFQEVTVSFDNGIELVVHRNSRSNTKGAHLPLTISLRKDGRECSIFKPTKPIIDKLSLDFPISALDDMIPQLERVGPDLWRNAETEEMMDLADVLMTFGDELPVLGEAISPSDPDWLNDIKRDISVRLIGTERLTGDSASQNERLKFHKRLGRSGWTERFSTKRTVRIYSEELAELTNQAMAAYGTLSQSLDRTFPARVVADSSTTQIPMDELRINLDNIEARRKKLEEVGLLAREQESHFDVSSLDIVDASRHAVLHVYANDAKEKLSLFKDLYEKVSSFRRIVNSRFLYKKVAPDNTGLRVVSLNGQELDLEMLSSGEQHELVIIYELLFKTADNSLILIDEPELSLHVAWQEKFLSDLQEMAQLSNYKAILATHSPEIIGDRWDLTVELKGPKTDATTT